MERRFLTTIILIALGAPLATRLESGGRVACNASFDQLLPAPREVEPGAGCISLGRSIRLSIPQQWAGSIDRYRWIIDEALIARQARPVTIVKQRSAANLRIVPKPSGLPENGYELNTNNGAVELAASDVGGVFNGLATLAQFVEMSGAKAIELPRGHIRDWPEVATRAVHIDMTCQQYKAPYVQRLMRTLARYKVNAILMEYSDMFPFRDHKAIRRADAFNEDDIRSIRRTAEECNQEIIPFLQCAGHLEYVLTREQYAHLSEEHGGYSYCLANDAALPFAQSLIDEIVAQHPGVKRLHVGGDEVSAGTCKRCAAAGDFRATYLRHNAKIVEYCRKRGIQPLLWTDIIAPFTLQNQPDVIASLVKEAAQRLPRDVIGVDWRYDDNGFFVAPKLREAGFQAITAPAARSFGDVFALPRVSLHMNNIREAFLRAAQWRLLGTIITSWSYRGSPHEVCLPEYAAASYGWNTRDANVPALLARFFRQRYGLSEAIGQRLAEAALAETKEIVPTALGKPNLDVKKNAWMISAADQAGQLMERLRAEGDATRVAASLEDQLRLFTSHDRLWQSALNSATRHRSELRSWDLSRRHLEHRLRLSIALARSKSGVNVDQQLRLLAEDSTKMRSEWKDLYREVYTPPFLEVDLGIRFDAEPGIIAAVRQ